MEYIKEKLPVITWTFVFVCLCCFSYFYLFESDKIYYKVRSSWFEGFYEI